jgi:hypothetical protein
MLGKPFSQACENNKTPILQVLKTVLTDPVIVWEIGSGTGQHACYFAEQLPHIMWQPTDRAENLAGIELWRADAALSNLNAPVLLDVVDAVWPCAETGVDALFTANTLHIMSWRLVQQLFVRLGEYLNANAKVCLYGPFNYRNAYTSDSNARFDLWLKARDQLSGIRDFEAVAGLAEAAGLRLQDDVAMPANNHLLVFDKT